MNIGIVVHSQTGNTLAVAEKLKEGLEALGHRATIERIVAQGDPGDARSIRLCAVPDVSHYEAFAFGAPVQGFSLCPAMQAWLPLMPDLKGRKAVCFTTKKLGGNWTGGSKALALMGGAVTARGGKLCGSGIVHVGSKDRETAELVEKLARLF